MLVLSLKMLFLEVVLGMVILSSITIKDMMMLRVTSSLPSKVCSFFEVRKLPTIFEFNLKWLPLVVSVVEVPFLESVALSIVFVVLIVLLSLVPVLVPSPWLSLPVKLISIYLMVLCLVVVLSPLIASSTPVSTTIVLVATLPTSQSKTALLTSSSYSFVLCRRSRCNQHLCCQLHKRSLCKSYALLTSQCD